MGYKEREREGRGGMRTGQQEARMVGKGQKRKKGKRGERERGIERVRRE